MFGLFSLLQFYRNWHVSPNILDWTKWYWSFSRKTVLVSIFPGSCDIQGGSQADLVHSDISHTALLLGCSSRVETSLLLERCCTLRWLDWIKWSHGRNLQLLRKRKESKILLLRTESKQKGEMLEPAPHRHLHCGFFELNQWEWGSWCLLGSIPWDVLVLRCCGRTSPARHAGTGL